MTVDTELVAISIALLGIILFNWLYLHNIKNKIDKLFTLMEHSKKKEKDSRHTNGI